MNHLKRLVFQPVISSSPTLTIMASIVKLECIESGPQDYQSEIKSLKEALAHKTRLCERIEGKTGRLTMEVQKLKWELSEKLDENQSLTREKTLSSKKIQDLQMQLDMCQSIALLKQMQEETQRTTEILASTLAAEQRGSKRQRIVDLQ